MNTQLTHAETHPPRSWLPQPLPSTPPRSDARRVMVALAACMALQMTSFVMILPLFARRFSELGAGVGALGASEVAYAIATTVAAPFMGALSDRFGRRPLVLGSLAAYALAFTGYLLARSASGFIVLRGLAGGLTAGLMPAATGVVADLAPSDRRAQWIGILSGGASIGWIVGPIIGGMLYDHMGYSAALLVSIGMAAVTFAVALLGIPETRPHTTTLRLASTRGETGPHPSGLGSGLGERWQTFRLSLPPALTPLLLALFVYFAVMFAWAFIEPRFMFYAYDDLGWSSSMLGLVMSTYGFACMLGEFGLGRLSDRFGRKPVIVLGLLLFSAQFIGLALVRDYAVIAVAFVIAGLGNALFDPALSASILDVAPRGTQGRLLGLKSTVGSLGNIAGPLLIVLFASVLQARWIFFGAAGIVLLSLLITVLIRPAPESSLTGLTGQAARAEVNP
jgi:MFS family permease